MLVTYLHGPVSRSNLANDRSIALKQSRIQHWKHGSGGQAKTAKVVKAFNTIFAQHMGSPAPSARQCAFPSRRSTPLPLAEAPGSCTRRRYPWLPVEAGKTYTLSGYVKTQEIEPTEGHGAAIYVPVVGDSPYQQPNAPWITGTRDWRKAIIVFSVSPDAENPQAVPRGQVQRATGIAWFDNFSLTEGTADGSLTITGGDQPLEVAGA
jgi:hypothetical protein